MKKLMIAAAIVCAAAFAQAAAINWSTGDLCGSNGEYISDNAGLGYSYSVVVTIAGLGDSTGSQDWDEFTGSYASAPVATDYTASILITEYKGGSVVATMSGSGAFTTNASESFDTTINFGSGNGFNTPGSKLGAWQPVPEPTSGLLMLLGVAGLALRRKRA